MKHCAIVLPLHHPNSVWWSVHRQSVVSRRQSAPNPIQSPLKFTSILYYAVGFSRRCF